MLPKFIKYNRMWFDVVYTLSIFVFSFLYFFFLFSRVSNILCANFAVIWGLGRFGDTHPSQKHLTYARNINIGSR